MGREMGGELVGDIIIITVECSSVLGRVKRHDKFSYINMHGVF
jgi:hypothetical protein